MSKYYETCPYPKPGNVRKKKKVNGYKDKPNRLCYYHGTPGADRHEVFRGANRQNSIDHGFQVDLCPVCHAELQADLTEWAQEQNLMWRRHYQKKYLKECRNKGMSEAQALRAWMILIGRNFLEECDPE